MKLPAVRMELTHNCNKRKEGAHLAELAKGKQIMKKMHLMSVLLERERIIALKMGFSCINLEGSEILC